MRRPFDLIASWDHVKACVTKTQKFTQNILNDNNVKTLTQIGSTLIDNYASFADNPTWWNGLKAGANILKHFSEEQEIWPYDYFSENDIWVSPFSFYFNETILEILSKFPYNSIKTSNEQVFLRFHTIEGVEFGYVTSAKEKLSSDQIYCRADQESQAQEVIRKHLWSNFSKSSIVLKKSQKSSISSKKITFEIDDSYAPMPSERSKTYSEYLKRCMDAGVHRSVMLYGPPGTGKSTMARTIVDLLKLRSVRIRVGDVGGINPSSLFECIDVFKPDVIILDDFDRSGNPVNMLETLEYFHNKVKLILATVNRRHSFDEALLRPGRFDELEFVKKMDDDVIKKMLGEKNLDVFEIVKNWPIAFINEYVNRTRFMSNEEAIESIKELATRVGRLSEFDDNSDQISRILHQDEETTEDLINSVIDQKQIQLVDPPTPPTRRQLNRKFRTPRLKRRIRRRGYVARVKPR